MRVASRRALIAFPYAFRDRVATGRREVSARVSQLKTDAADSQGLHIFREVIQKTGCVPRRAIDDRE